MYRHIEGPYWLAQILGKAYQAEEDVLISGQEIPKGYWLVEAQWYKLVSHLTSRAATATLIRLGTGQPWDVTIWSLTSFPYFSGADEPARVCAAEGEDQTECQRVRALA